MGKGSLWRVEQMQRQNLIQALTRSPFFPNSAVDKINLKGSSVAGSNHNLGYDVVDGVAGSNKNSNSSTSSHINPRFDPRLFPKLSKVFKDMKDIDDTDGLNDADGVDDDVPSDYSPCISAKYNEYTNNSQQPQNGSTDLVNNSNRNNGSSSIMGSFSNYESIEHLARDCGADNLDDVNAATAMLALKHGPKVFSESFQNG